MKYTLNLTIVFFLSLFSATGQSINGKITYLATSKYAESFYKKKVKKNKKEIKSNILKLYKNSKDVYSILEFNENRSLYYVVDKMEINNDNVNYTHILAGSEKKFYTNNNLMIYQNNTLDCFLLGECFLIENKIPKWELKNEAKKIQGFECYRAVIKNPINNKISVEVWYTPEIPYQYGVMNYFGLPGVILEINRNTFSMTAIKIELNPLEKIKIEEPKNAKKITEKEFKELTKKAMPEFYKN